jgi:uncharacterized protein
MDIICDTSFLMVLASTPIQRMNQLEAEIGKFHFLVPDKVIEELRTLGQRSGPKRSMIAKTALGVSKLNMDIINLGKKRNNVDEALIEYTLNHKCGLATLDKGLIRRLVAKNAFVVTLSRNRLVAVNPR